MGDYISREAVIRAVREYDFTHCPEYMRDWATKLKRAILGDIVDTITEETPAADVEPVKRGEWLTDENRDRTWCSVCNVNCGVNYDQAIEEMNYCPNCGSKMKG